VKKWMRVTGPERALSRVRFRAAMQEWRVGDAVYVEMNAHPLLALWIVRAIEEANISLLQ